MLQTILISVAHVAIVTGISIAWCKWYMDKKKVVRVEKYPVESNENCASLIAMFISRRSENNE